MSYFPERPNQNLHAFAFSHRHGEHARIQHKPAVIWMTGISASGKSTIADALDLALQEQGRITAIIDGDSVRGGLCRDLGFTDSDRDENIRRVAEVARLMLEAGLIVIVALISPSSASRHYARSIIGNGRLAGRGEAGHPDDHGVMFHARAVTERKRVQVPMRRVWKITHGCSLSFTETGCLPNRNTITHCTNSNSATTQ